MRALLHIRRKELGRMGGGYGGGVDMEHIRHKFTVLNPVVDFQPFFNL